MKVKRLMICFERGCKLRKKHKRITELIITAREGENKLLSDPDQGVIKLASKAHLVHCHCHGVYLWVYCVCVVCRWSHCSSKNRSKLLHLSCRKLQLG